MVRLFRAPVRPARGRTIVRPPFMNPRQMHPPYFDPHYVTPMPRPRGQMFENSSGRPPLPLPPRYNSAPRPRLLPPRPPMPHRPFHPAEIRPHMLRPVAETRPLPRPLGGCGMPPLRHGPRSMPPRHMPPRPMFPLPPQSLVGLHPSTTMSPAAPIAMNMFPPIGPRGRGRFPHGRIGVKRMGTRHTATGRVKKRKEKTEEMEVNKPWVTEALKSEIKKKYQLYKIAKEKKNDSDWLLYKNQRILVGKMTNTAKLEYIGSHPEVDVDQIMFGAAAKG